MTDAELTDLILTSINSVSVIQHERLDLDAPLENLGLDSLGVTQVIMDIEDSIGAEMPMEALDGMMEVRTLRGMYDILIQLHYINAA